MNKHVQPKIDAIYDELVSLEESERSLALAERCAGDETLRLELVERLGAAKVAEQYLVTLSSRTGLNAAEERRVSHAHGRQIGAYRLGRVLGRGGMGVVYLAERADNEFTKEVALKLLPMWLTGTLEKKRFRQERQILAGLEHPNIARLLDGGVTEEGVPWYAMEYVRGQPVDVYCEARRLDLDQRLNLFLQICSAVAYAHRKLIVHRDLKPDNILISDDGVPKLLDFGIARWVENNSALAPTATNAAERRLTPAFAAPELFRGEPASTACDIYALGVILYELLSGKRPYQLENAAIADWLEAFRHTQPRASVAAAPNRDWSRRLRGDLDTILGKALRAEPERRYLTVNGFAQDIQRYRDGLPVSAAPDSRWYRTSRFISRHRVGVSFVTFAFVLLLGLAGASSYYAWRINTQIAITEQERDKALATSNFLTSIFAGASPYENQGQSLTARELVGQGLSELQTRSDLPLETRARLFQVLGVVSLDLSDFEMARVALEQSRNLTRLAFGSNSLEYASVLMDLAEREFSAGDLLTANQQLDAALRILASPSMDRAEALYLKAATLGELGNYEHALGLAGESLGMLRDLETDGVAIAQGLNLVAFIEEQRGRFDRAEAGYRRALAVAQQQEPPGSILLAKLYNNLGRLKVQQHQFETGRNWHRQALDLRLEIFGELHRATATSHLNLGAAFHGLGNLAAAKAHAARAVSTLNTIIGSSHWLTARAEVNLALILADSRQIAWADSLLQHAHTITVDNYGQNHRETADVLLAQAYVLNTRARFAQAAAIAQQAQQVLAALSIDHEPLNRKAQLYFAVSLYGTGKQQQADVLYARYCTNDTFSSDAPLNARSIPCRLAFAASE